MSMSRFAAASERNTSMATTSIPDAQLSTRQADTLMFVKVQQQLCMYVICNRHSAEPLVFVDITYSGMTAH